VWRDPAPWNHNIHYHPLILQAVPGGCRRCLDVGCGEGFLARELRRVVPQVVGIDKDEPTVARARRNDGGAGVAYVLSDFLGASFRPESFDMIVSIAALHHMDAAAALRRMRELLRPGGTLALVGLGRSRWPGDLPAELAASVAHRVLRLRRTFREVAAPIVWPPPQTYAQMRRIAAQVLPGVRYRRHLLWRYSLVWVKPAEPADAAGRPS
jgi:SAM-dependent methyltransferase